MTLLRSFSFQTAPYKSAHELSADGEREQRGRHGAEDGFEHDERLRGVRRRARLRLLQRHHARAIQESIRPSLNLEAANLLDLLGRFGRGEDGGVLLAQTDQEGRED